MVSATYLVDLILLDIGGMARILEKREEALAAAPVFILVVVSMISTSAPVFRYSAGETAMIERRDNYFLEVISEADKAGEDRAVITTPPWYPGVISDDSGLYAEYLSSTLYKYGVTTKRMEIVFETD